VVAIIRAKINSGLMPPQSALALLVGGAGGLVARWVGLLTPAFTGLDLATCVIGSTPVAPSRWCCWRASWAATCALWRLCILAARWCSW